MSVSKSSLFITVSFFAFALGMQKDIKDSLIAAVLEGRFKIVNHSELWFPGYNIPSNKCNTEDFTFNRPFKEAAAFIIKAVGKQLIVQASQKQEENKQQRDISRTLREWLWEFYENRDVDNNPQKESITKQRALLWKGFQAQDVAQVTEVIKNSLIFNKELYNIRNFLQKREGAQNQENEKSKE